MYCPQREENKRKREEGRKTRYANPAIVEAWQNSHDAWSFSKQLEARGYQLAQGRKRLVVVDPHGKSSNPTRDLKAAFGRNFDEQEFRDRMSPVNLSSLPTPEAIKESRAIESEQRVERQKAFEAKVAEVISRQTEKHRGERSSVLEQHQRSIERKCTELENFYQLEKQHAHIGKLQDRLENPSLLRKIGFLLFRTDRKLQIDLQIAEMGFDSSRKRFVEALSALEGKRDHELKQLNQRQDREIETLTRRLKEWSPSEPNHLVVKKEHVHDHLIGHEVPQLKR